MASAKTLRRMLNKIKQQILERVPSPEPPRYQFNQREWERLSRRLPKCERRWLLDGIREGFDIYVKRDRDLSRLKVQNLPMSLIEQVRAAEWILDNMNKSAVWGPFKADGSDLPDWLRGKVRVSPIGTVPKGIHFGVEELLRKWRVIHHLSHPRSGFSVNTEVIDEWATVQYVQFREVVEMVRSLGKGAWLWTVDAKDAYLRVPIKRDAMQFMGFKFFGRLFIFTSLSFGLASAPKIYTRFADNILDIIRLHYGDESWWRVDGQDRVFHYIDDFFGGAEANRKWMADKQFRAHCHAFNRLTVPTTEEKIAKPATRQKILGFIYDTIQQKVFIPAKKKAVMLSEIEAISAEKQVTKRRILSLVGKLRWASVCIFAGPAFVRRMEELANTAKYLDHRVNVSPMRGDLSWWAEQIRAGADGISFDDILRHRANGDVNIYTDASTGIGMGGWSRNGDWFRFRWTDHERVELFADPKSPDIYWKEMAAVATAALLWGHKWSGKAVTFWIDNEACVWSLVKRRCDFARGDVMELIRIFASCANRFKFQPYFLHIAGKDNLTADALSRFDLRKFQDDTDGIEMRTTESPCRWALSFLVDRALQ